ncbi:MAG: hypothetical protein IH951_15370 [Bacteroidetes bacterium]|nr:hypothetical protein [Bacteroidota bacterium]
MFVAIQFPLCDIRSFVGSDTSRLNLPAWPNAVPGREFIRSSGIIKHRTRGGLDSCAGEEIYCKAWRALRFQPNFYRQSLGNLGTSLVLICAFRRYLSDGIAVSRVELGLTVKERESSEFVFPFYQNDCLDFIQGLLALSVKIPLEKSNFANCELINCNKYLAIHYLKSTTRRTAGILAHTQGWWLTPGNPLVIIEYEYDEIEQLPKYSQSVKSKYLLPDALHYCKVELAHKRLTVWFLRREHNDLDLTRRIRLHLFRLHAERECLKQIVRLVVQGKLNPRPRSESSDRLQEYFKDQKGLLSKKTLYGLEPSKIFEESQRFENIVTPGERATLLTTLSHIRKNYLNSLEKYTRSRDARDGRVYVYGNHAKIYIAKLQNIGGETVTEYNINFGDHTNIVGDFVVADTIQSSFNKISSSEAKHELKEELGKLHKVVVELTKHLSQDKATPGLQRSALE